MEFIKTEGLFFSYDEDSEENRHREKKYVLSDIDLSINKGEFVSVIGHNGCGKSTLSKLLNALYVPDKGKVFVNGMDTSLDENTMKVRRLVGLVLQNPDNQLVASIVEEDVAFGPENLGIEPEEIRRRVDEALKAVDMYEMRDRAPHKLSGGQKQRVAIAGIIAMEPQCIVLDEPTAMLDPKGREEVLLSIKKLNKEKGITVVLITHNMDETVYSDKVIVMDKGRIFLQGTPREVFSKVQELKIHRLDSPQVTELCYKLRNMGMKIDHLPLDTDECEKMLSEVLL